MMPPHTAIRLSIALILMLVSWPAQAATFERWVANFRSEARQQGITDETFDKAFARVTANSRVIALDRKQPEKKIGFDKYQHNTITPGRIEKGRRLLRENWALLSTIENEYGVQAQYIVALWGMETSYGENTGGFDIIQALATLAWEGRRGDYFKSELIQALKILQDGHVDRQNFKGSWAGAMGQNQFMPTSWRNFAVDENGDGHRDIWTTRADVFASSANYLARNGWTPGQRWGRQVRLPVKFDKRYVGANQTYTLSEWQRLGVRAIDGSNLPHDDNVRASLVIPDGGNGKSFLVYNNYKTILRWNRSVYFGISVGMLADLIAAGQASHRATRASPNP